MSVLSELTPKKGSMHKSKRLGRGRGSNQGGTGGKGHKGQKARSGGTVRRGFEGGQMPLWQRLPKFGFNNKNFTKRYDLVNLRDLARLDGEVNPESLLKSGLVRKGMPIKILGMGQLDKALTVTAHKFSDKAKSAIEAAGGKVEVIK